jgi:hypothetical protein
MQRVLIIIANCALLVLLLIGLPVATRDQVGNLQLSSAATGRMMMLVGLGIAAGVNVFFGLFLIKSPKNKVVCWEWAGIFAALWLVYFAFIRHYFNFDWLKKSLLWLQHHL